MSQGERVMSGAESLSRQWGDFWKRLVLPAVVAVVVVTALLLVIVSQSVSAWHLLGVGRGFIEPDYYHVSGFLIVWATTLGQALGWAGGSGFAYYAMTLVGLPRTLLTARLAMSVVYLGLTTLPLTVYHVFFGQPLLGLAREGMEAALRTQHADAYWLLMQAHPYIDGSLAPLGLLFLAVLWGSGEALRRHWLVHTILALAVIVSSMSVALSLGIHSTLAHLKL